MSNGNKPATSQRNPLVISFSSGAAGKREKKAKYTAKAHHLLDPKDKPKEEKPKEERSLECHKIKLAVQSKNFMKTI